MSALHFRTPLCRPGVRPGVPDSATAMMPLLVVLAFLAGAVVASVIGRRGRRRGSDSTSRDVGAALKERDELDASRVRFFGNIAHELGTPVTLVLGQIDAALTEEDAEARAHALRVAARSARRIERLREQALQLTRLDAGTLALNARDLDTVPFLEALVLSFEELAERKGLLLEFFARPRSIPARVDPDHLTTIVSNLVSNAMKYTPAGGRVGVAVEVVPAPGADTAGHGAAGARALRLAVADTGPGIAADRHQTIFQRFARGPEDGRLHPDGAGIGLALVKQLAKLHGGDATVESEPGRGARFLVTLPLPALDALGPRSPQQTVHPRPAITEEILRRTTAEASPPEPTPGRPTVLVVDDNADAGEWLAAELAEIGDTVWAGDATRALALARETVPDAVVTDLRMPGIGGLELCRRLRADERTSHIPIVLVSVQSDVDRRVDGLDAGADAYLPKPVDPRELRALVSNLLSQRESLRERFRERVIVRPSELDVRSVDPEFLDQVVDTIEDQLGNADFSVSELADAVAMSRSQLTRKLKSLLGQSPGQLIRSLRLQRGADLLVADAGSVARIAYSVAVADQAHFTRAFKRHFGVTPSAYRKNAEQLPEGTPVESS